ncbi:MAG: undecaprenyl-diphosphate phosphatase [Thermoleophilaceae bacterium]
MARHSRAASPRGRGRLTVRQALALGLIQGPAELLPVSSSGHLVLVPALLGWPYARLDAHVRKTFEVALHTGAGLALAWLRREDARAALLDPAGTALLAGPAAAIAFALEPVIEERLSNPRVAATAQIASGCALAVTDMGGVRPRHTGDAPRALDRLIIGLAQTAALIPGVSRNGATLTAARALGFRRADAARLSWRAGLPIIGGATVLKLARVAQRGLDRDLRAPFAAGAAAAFASTLAARPLLRLAERPYAPLAAYRVALGALALRRLHRLQ